MMSGVRRASRWFRSIGVADTDDDREKLTKTLLVTSSTMMAGLAVVWGAVYLALGQPRSAAIPLSYSGLSLATIVAFAQLCRYSLFRSSQLALSLALPFLLDLSLGGIVGSSGVVLWSVTCPLGALVFASDRQARAWFVAFVGVVVIALALDPVVRDQSSLSDRTIVLLAAMNIVGVSTVAFVLVRYSTTRRLAAQEMSDSLLLNILPAPIAETLRHSRHTIAQTHDNASVLFADLVGFTPISSQMTAHKLVELLNEVFTFIDGVAGELGVEKIKTIGDCYMAAAGVPERRGDHAEVLAEMAIRIHEHVAIHTFAGQHLRFRIGIHSGSVVAGVIGIRKFSYDLWGDVVNTASRMESHGRPGTTQITAQTHELIKERFECEPGGLVDVKGKGSVEVWCIVARRR